MIRAELLAQQAAIVWSCAGPLLLGEARKRAAEVKRDAYLAAGDMAGLCAFLVELHALVPRLSAAILARAQAGTSTLEDVAQASAQLFGARTSCGHDLKPLIQAAPFDGQVHSATCPQCGTEHEWRAPQADDDMAAAAAAHDAALAALLD